MLLFSLPQLLTSTWIPLLEPSCHGGLFLLQERFSSPDLVHRELMDPWFSRYKVHIYDMHYNDLVLLSYNIGG